MADKFIQGAIKHPGALTKKAAAAGMSIDEFASAHKSDSDQTGDQARFYLGVLRPATKNAEKPPKNERQAAAEFILGRKKK